MRRLNFVDIEANGLTPTKIWCVSIKADGVMRTYDYAHLQEAKERLEGRETMYVFHNGISYDLPVLKKLLGVEIPLNQVCDTMVLSRLLRCDRPHKHSLEAWGERLGLEKVPDLDWNVYSRGMLGRCERDVEITEALYHHLQKEMGTWDWEEAVRLEYKTAYWHAKQEENGVGFDIEAAKKLAAHLRRELDTTVAALKSKMPFTMSHSDRPVLPFKIDGGLKAIPARRFDNPSCIWGPYTNVDFSEPNPNSDPQIKSLLSSLGWVPEEWNYKKDPKTKKPLRPLQKSSPKITSDSLVPLGDVGALIIKRGMLQHRFSILDNLEDDTKGLISNVRVDGRVVAGGIPMGTPTSRYIHSGVVNIPKAKDHIPYGKELRSLFIAEEGHVLIGSDAKGLESRCEAHYTFPYDGGEYARELLEGDIHQKNADIWGVLRDIAKNGKYCLSYGGQAAKLASTLHVRPSLGTEYFDAFWDGNIALKRLKKDVERALHKGYLRGLDGRKLYVRSPHSALNMLFQSAGSIIVKTATCLMNEQLTSSHLPYKQVIHMHDEVVFEVKDDAALIKEVVDVIDLCWKEAGTMLRVNVPILGDTNIGHSWADVH